MKKILLLVPKMNGPGNGKQWNSHWSDKLEAEINESSYQVITPGVLVVAGLTDQTTYDVTVVDEAHQTVNPEVSYDIVAMYTITPNVKRAIVWSKHFRSKGAYVVFGGVHATVFRDDVIDSADTLLIGEAEYNWPKFLSDFESGRPQAVYVQPAGSVSLSDSAIPAFEHIPDHLRKIIPIQATRGCPHACKFCNIRQLYGRAYRRKSISRIRDEIQAALKVAPNAVLYFTDDNFFVDKNHARNLLEVIEGFNVKWYAHSDISLGENEILVKRAFDSGCRQILIGLESMEPANLDSIDETNFKRNHFDSYRELISRIQRRGIGVIGSIILGLDMDRSTVFEKTLNFIRSSNLYGASITVNTPYPGTVMFDRLKKENRITTYDWDQYTIFQPIVEPKHMTLEKLNDSLINLLHSIRSPENTNRKIQYFKEIYRSLHDAKSG